MQRAQEGYTTLRGGAVFSLCGALLLCFPGRMSAQNTPVDTSAIYKKLHDYSQKHKVAKWIYEGIFVAPSSEDEPPMPGKKPAKRVDVFRKYKGKWIRHVRAHVNDPFGYSVDDTSQAPTGRLQRIGNKLHVRTHEQVIRSLLLMREGERLDPLKLTESERLLRASPVVNAARIMVHRVPGATDSVDLEVSVLDKWTIDVVGGLSTSDGSITVRDRNLLGFGQRFEQGVGYSLGASRPDLNGQYVVYNIADSYIGTSAFYSATAAQDQVGVEAHRDFFSPLTKWAGGAALTSTWTHYSTTDSSGSEIALPRVRPVSLDIWGGRSFPLLNDTTLASRLSRIIVGVRYAQTRFTQRPSFEQDTLRMNTNTSLLLVGAGLSQQQFYKERYLFRFGLTEDVPEGLLVRVNAGVRKRELATLEPYRRLGIGTTLFHWIVAEGRRRVGVAPLPAQRGFEAGAHRAGHAWARAGRRQQDGPARQCAPSRRDRGIGRGCRSQGRAGDGRRQARQCRVLLPADPAGRRARQRRYHEQ